VGVAMVTCPTFEAMGQIPMFHRTYFLFCSKLVNVTSCDVAHENGIEHCQVSVVQDFVHVGQQTAYISVRSYADNLTIHSQMLVFHGIIAGELIFVVLRSTTVVSCILLSLYSLRLASTLEHLMVDAFQLLAIAYFRKLAVSDQYI